MQLFAARMVKSVQAEILPSAFDVLPRHFTQPQVPSQTAAWAKTSIQCTDLYDTFPYCKGGHRRSCNQPTHSLPTWILMALVHLSPNISAQVLWKLLKTAFMDGCCWCKSCTVFCQSCSCSTCSTWFCVCFCESWLLLRGFPSQYLRTPCQRAHWCLNLGNQAHDVWLSRGRTPFSLWLPRIQSHTSVVQPPFSIQLHLQ